jgi:DNA-binding response OmpR family regulator
MTVMDELQNKMHGIEISSDFYITKPFLPTELLARVNAILRHTTKPAPLISNGHGAPTL